MKNWFKRVIFRIKHGFLISDLWNLDYIFGKFILPRLIEFRKYDKMGYPGQGFKNIKEWNETIDKMIWSFDYIVNDRMYEGNAFDLKKIEKERKKCQEGLNLFAKYFNYLWD